MSSTESNHPSAKALRSLINEAQFHLIFDSLSFGVAVKDLEGNILQSNKAIQKFLNYSKDELSKKNTNDVTFPEDYELIDRQRHMLKTGAQDCFSGMKRYLRKDGITVWGQYSHNLIRDPEGQPCLIFCIIEDAHHLRETQQMVELLADFPRSNPNPIFSFDSQGVLMYLNPRAKKLFEDSKEVSPLSVLPEDICNIVKKSYETEEQASGLTTSVGQEHFSWFICPIPNKNSVHVYGFETTEQTRLLNLVRHIQKMESIGRLAGGIAHDFNNILGVISNFAELTLMDPNMTDSIKANLEQIISTVERASGLTKQLLTFSRGQQMTPTNLDLNHIIGDVSKMLVRIVGENVRVSFLPTEEQIFINADKTMIEQVIVNLVVNARDAMPDGGEVTIKTHPVTLTDNELAQIPNATGRDYALIKIKDSGTGIDESILPHIFEPFFSTKNKGKGTGLGLSIVYGIVKQHKGWIKVESEKGQFTEFKIFIPRTQEGTNEEGEE
jgi:PAS domain S-box-containing protein